MNKHLELARAMHSAFSLPQGQEGTHEHVSDMDIVMRQALLMEAGSEVLRAVKAGEMAEILGGLADLAYIALGAVAMRGENVAEQAVTWRHDGSVLSVMRLLSEKIGACASAESERYSDVYCVCAHLASSFLNADFDKALQVLHGSYMAVRTQDAQTAYADIGEIRRSKSYQYPDFNDCLYE
ncbi:MAG: nucleoside triphosphate pyrophosphohydrolase family protein [Gammaproteobacteria bacterium]